MSSREHEPLLHVSVLSAGRTTVVALGGELDIAGAADLRDRLRTVLGPAPPPRLVVDVSRLEFVDAAGLAPLFEVAARLRSRGARFELRHPATAVRLVLDTLGLTHELLPVTGGGGRPPGRR